ncbi:hypothetical protein I302_108737 [Kwoniella bestiolae CBS 10118]|uniref:Uncharacterized protein n=1 Tax=Kwoniella bestiolae CBS 10118 TaxID=1296100 RepID=A0A1B9FTX9_9TREE|nr:hypothetical protein I302_07874 [Kwoniella bestiolae CBS 10118]OCF22229.1 hypothetical protein I302_07874 [Kwoniella bestiolae CBS 10118]
MVESDLSTPSKVTAELHRRIENLEVSNSELGSTLALREKELAECNSKLSASNDRCNNLLRRLIRDRLSLTCPSPADILIREIADIRLDSAAKSLIKLGYDSRARRGVQWACDGDPKLEAECEKSDHFKREVLSFLKTDPQLNKDLEDFIAQKVANEYSNLIERRKWPGGKVSWTTRVFRHPYTERGGLLNVDVDLTFKSTFADPDPDRASQVAVGRLLQFENPDLTLNKYQRMTDCSSSPEYIISLRRELSSRWIEYGKEIRRGWESENAVGVLHYHGPLLQSYTQTLENKIRPEILGCQNRTTSTKHLDRWIRDYSQRAVSEAWNHPKFRHAGYHKLGSALERLPDNTQVVRAIEPNKEDDPMGTMVETDYGDSQCCRLQPSERLRHAISDWIGDSEVTD